MTVQKDVTKNIYVGNGSTRTFPFTFECPAEHPEYIKVYLMQDDGTALATSDYQLDMDARQITYPSSGTALPEGKKLVIMRELPLQQMMNLVNNGPYFAEDVETAFDENVMAMQQIAEKLNRSIIMNVDIDGDAFVNEVPFEAGKSFRIADDGKSIVLTEDPARVLPLAQEAYAQAQAQAQIASASAAAAAKSENSAFESAGVAGNSAQYASLSAASAAENAELTSGYKQEALNAKADATASATNAKASEANAKISENNAEASKEAAQSAASNANNFATSARSSASEAKSYRDAANNYAANAKNYSENVNVFLPSVSASGVLSWTNKAGLANPASVNIKGATGAPGAAASIHIGNVVTGAPGTDVVVTNSGTSSAAILNFQIPRGTPGADGGVTVDDVLNSTSFNPVANRTVYAALQEKVSQTKLDELDLTSGILTVPSSSKAFISKIVNDTLAPINNITQLTIEQSADGETWETLFDSATTDENWKKAYVSGLIFPAYLNVTKGYMARITFATHTTTYFSSIAFYMKAIASNSSTSGSNYKCYCGFNTLDTTIVRASDNIRTWGSWVNTIFKNTGSNIVQYVFNEDRNEDVTLLFGGALCKGTKAYRNVLNYDDNQGRTVSEYPVKAPTFIGKLTGTADKATSDGAGNVIAETYAKIGTANTWTAIQAFKYAKLGYEKYASSKISSTSAVPLLSVAHYIATGAFTLNLNTHLANLAINESSVFTAYIESSADYPLTITNAGTLKYIGYASDIAITSAGLLLNILMLKDASGNVTSIVQASKLEGGA